MIIYSVTVSVDPEIHLDWLEWMQKHHIPDVLATGYFKNCRFIKVRSDEDSGPTYNFQYLAESEAMYQAYAELHAPKLQADVKVRYGEKFVAFRMLLDLVEEISV